MKGSKHMEKVYPKIGDHLYLSQRTGNYWVDSVKNPYTVIAVTPVKVKVQKCRLIFNGPRYYDSYPDEIEEDKDGEILELVWAPKKKRWQIDKYKTGYPEIAFFGEWQFEPYLN